MSFSYTNIMSSQVWKYYDHKAKKPEWKEMPNTGDRNAMKANFAKVKEAGFGIVKFYTVKGTDIVVGHEAVVTDGIRNLPSDFPVRDMDKLVTVRSNVPSRNNTIGDTESDIPFETI